MWFSFPLSPTTTTATTNKHWMKTCAICPGCFPGDGLGWEQPAVSVPSCPGGAGGAGLGEALGWKSAHTEQ